MTRIVVENWTLVEGDLALNTDFYTVFKGVRNSDKRIATVYRTNRSVLENMPQFPQITNIVETLTTVVNQNTQELIDCIIMNEDLYLIMSEEKVPFFSIFANSFVLDESITVKIFYQLFTSVAHLHSHQICHRDIRPETIFFDSNNDLKLCRFFYAGFLDKDGMITGECGCPNYQAPEVWSGKPYDGKKADVWSCGVLLLSCYMNHNLFEAETEEEVKELVLNKEISYEGYLPQPVAILIERMLDRNPETRISFMYQQIWALFVKFGFFLACIIIRIIFVMIIAEYFSLSDKRY